MSRFCGEMDSGVILSAASHWRDAALLAGGSVLTQRKLWTADALSALDKNFVNNLDAGKDKFLQKLERQLAPAEPAAKQLAAEMMWLMYLCPSSLTVNHKRQTVQTIWSWSGEAFPSDSTWLSDQVLNGIGSAGPGFNQNQWRELTFLIKFVLLLRAEEPQDQHRIVHSSQALNELLTGVPEWESRQLRHMLLFLLFPDNHERIFGQIDRKTVVRHFSSRDKREVNRMDPTQIDDELRSIRSRLEREKGTAALDFYVSPLKEEWKTETIAAATEALTSAHVLKALDEIDRDGIPKDAESTGYDLIHGRKRYPPKLVLSLAVKYATGEPLDRASFSGGEESSAFRLLRRLGFEITEKHGGAAFPELMQRFLAQALSGRELGVQDYITEYAGLRVKVSFGKGNFARIPWIAFLADGQSVSQGIYPVFLLFREERTLLLCYGISEEKVAEKSWGEIQGVTSVKEWFRKQYGRSPERYGASLVCESYDASGDLPLADMQQALDLVIQYYSRVLENFSGMHEPLPVLEDLSGAVQSFSRALSEASVRFGSGHDALVATFIASIATKPLAILTGLSGSGKTQIAIRFGEWLGEGRMHVAAVRPDWTGSEALFGYEDGLKTTINGQAAWSVPAPLEFMLKAASDPQHPHLLILDEMNLAHVERYFADVLSGMESGQPCIPNLVRGIDGCWRVQGDGPSRVPFPRNLWIVGTVNVDETTYMFSPKVLDRANTFEFRVETKELDGEHRKPSPCSPEDPGLVRGLLSIAKNDDWQWENKHESHALLSGKLRQLHEVLSRYGMEFGHRVFYESIRFSALAQGAGIGGMEAALDRSLMQNILPRLHGSRRQLELPLLAILQYCRDLPDVVDSDDKLSDFPAEASTTNAKLPIAYSKAFRMLKSLRANQFASFTE